VRAQSALRTCLDVGRPRYQHVVRSVQGEISRYGAHGPLCIADCPYGLGENPRRTRCIGEVRISHSSAFSPAADNVLYVYYAGLTPLRGSMAYAMMFGLAFATVLTLLLCPVLYDRFLSRDNERPST
jgi:hypothetical protein